MLPVLRLKASVSLPEFWTACVKRTALPGATEGIVTVSPVALGVPGVESATGVGDTPKTTPWFAVTVNTAELVLAVVHAVEAEMVAAAQVTGE